MESFLELPPTSSKPRSYYFDRNSVINSTLYCNSQPSYTIMTNKSGTRTDVCDIATQSVVATIKRREVFADTIKFPARNNGTSVAINKWLRPITHSPYHAEPSISLVTDVGNFVWESDAAHRLALYAEEDHQVPVAFFSRNRQPQDAIVLVMKSGAEEMVEDVIVSFIILEQRLRMKEKRRQNGMMYGPLSDSGGP
ncbi:unnamed protein product [Cyclocybe aegerita]|uniref:DUF6593 domain-containing protein n=1 Tax=Cyclocybe aegerita TaxID=1973307 RepID=A0A8S0W867_CYCAE|nr:unnamed protein product [Cyclocybe aegerita]